MSSGCLSSPQERKAGKANGNWVGCLLGNRIHFVKDLYQHIKSCPKSSTSERICFTFSVEFPHGSSPGSLRPGTGSYLKSGFAESQHGCLSSMLWMLLPLSRIPLKGHTGSSGSWAPLLSAPLPPAGTHLCKDVQRGTSTLTRLQGPEQGPLVHDPSPSAVHHAHALLALGEGAVVQQAWKEGRALLRPRVPPSSPSPRAHSLSGLTSPFSAGSGARVPVLDLDQTLFRNILNVPEL